MADEDILTFEQLKSLQNTEQDEDTLGELDDTFLKRVKDYLDRKQRIGGHLNDKEYRNAKHIVQDILDSRQKKIIRLAFLSTKSDIVVDNLLPEEEVLFDTVRESITEHREDIEDTLFGDGDGPETAYSSDEDTSTGPEEEETTASTDADPDTAASGNHEPDRENEPDDTDRNVPEEDPDTGGDDDRIEADEKDDRDAKGTVETSTPDETGPEEDEDSEDDDDGEVLFGGSDDSEADEEEAERFEIPVFEEIPLDCHTPATGESN